MAKTMKAIRIHGFGGPDVLIADEVAVPAPGPTQVLVRVHAAGVNPVDWKTRAGQGMAPVLGDPPLILGWDVSGEVVETGPGVERFAVGDEVFGMVGFPFQAGCYAEYVTASSRNLAPKPKRIEHVEAAALPLAGLTACQALFDTARLAAGQTVLVHGAGGGVGHLAVQLARWRGARVIATASGGKHEMVRGLGADEVIDYARDRFDDLLRDAALDLVVDTVGGDVTRRSVEVVRQGGAIVQLAGALDPAVKAEAEGRGVRLARLLVEPDRAQMERIAQLAHERHLRPSVQVVPFTAAARAHELGEQGHNRGKYCLRVVS